MQLRNYQSIWETDIYNAWQHNQNVLGVMPTGGGKTPVLTKILNNHDGYSWAIAHRRELLGQISTKLALWGLRHKIIAPKDVINSIIKLHIETIGSNFYDPSARCTVASIDTLKARRNTLQYSLNNASLWVIDEAHHCIRKNKWGQIVAMFPNAKGLGVTATPIRADGCGLGRHADGVFDTIVEGPGMRDLINMGYLSDYRIFAPPSDLDLTGVPVGQSGEFSHKKLVQRIQKSHIVGDVVSHYLRIAPGKLGMTFATDIATGTEIAAQFRRAGVPAEIVTGTTPGHIRTEIARRFREHKILQLVNVDLYGEGVDVPELYVISMARPTQSFGLFRQQFGRVLRHVTRKTAIVIDHVSNVKRHGLPDAYRVWSLDRRERGASKKPADIPTRTCGKCTAVYEAIYKQCPYCGFEHIPAERSRPEYVEGDLTELDTATLATMRGEIDRIDAPADILRTKMEHAGASNSAIYGATKNHVIRQGAQKALRESMAWWAGHCENKGRTLSECYRLFYFTFGMDAMTAQTLGRKKAEELTISINTELDRMIQL